MKKVKAEVVIFDQGNTLLLDPFPEVLSKIKDKIPEVLEKYNVNVSLSKLINAWKNANRTIDYPYISHFWQEEPIVSKALESLRILHQINDPLSLSLLQLYRWEFKNYVKNCKRNKEIKSTIEILLQEGKRLGVFSNDRRIDLLNNMELMGIEKYFEYLFSSEDIKIEKPDLRVFQHMLDHFKVPKEKIVYIGDDPVRDIEASNKFGFQSILYKVSDKYQEKWRDYSAKTKYKPNATIEKFAEILKVLV